MSFVLGVTRREDAIGVGRHDDDRRGGRADRPEKAEVLVGRRDDLVPRLEAETAEHDRASLARGRRERHLLRFGVDERRERTSELLAGGDRLLEVRHAGPALGEIAGDPRRHRLRDRPRERAEGARVEVRDPLEHREERSRLVERHRASTSTTQSTGGWSESTTPSVVRRSRAQGTATSAEAPRTST